MPPWVSIVEHIGEASGLVDGHSLSLSQWVCPVAIGDSPLIWYGSRILAGAAKHLGRPVRNDLAHDRRGQVVSAFILCNASPMIVAAEMLAASSKLKDCLLRGGVDLEAWTFAGGMSRHKGGDMLNVHYCSLMTQAP